MSVCVVYLIDIKVYVILTLMTTLLNIEEPCVSFGKYKGKVYSELLRDQNYIEWCIQNGALKKNEPNLYNIIINQTVSQVDDNCTPEHNRLQNQFMELDIINRLLKSTHKEKISRLNDMLEAVNLQFYKFICHWEFESYFNWDVTLRFTRCIFRDPSGKEYQRDEVQGLLEGDTKWNFNELNLELYRDVHIIELKPSVGDDYPNILRKMIKQSETMYIDPPYRSDSDVRKYTPKIQAKRLYDHHMFLIIEKFTSETTDFEKLKQIYKQSGIDVYIFDHLKSLSAM